MPEAGLHCEVIIIVYLFVCFLYILFIDVFQTTYNYSLLIQSTIHYIQH